MRGIVLTNKWNVGKEQIGVEQLVFGLNETDFQLVRGP